MTLVDYMTVLGTLIHDTSQKNRIALLDLLLSVKDIPDIK
jgi:hypothetical protein